MGSQAWAAVCLSIGIAITSAGCGGGSSSSPSTPGGTPAILTHPASQAVAPGQTATFSATASGTNPLTYQWQKNGTAISGATTSSYTTPPVTLADNGAKFRVVVSNSAR